MESLLKRIEQCYDKLPEAQKKVARFIVNDGKHVAFLNLENLASEIGVSTTTIIRFARSIGYKGYSDLQEQIQSMVKARVGLPERLAMSTDCVTQENLLVYVFQQDIRNIQATLENLNDKALQEAVRLMASAHTVFVVGLRSSFSVAYFFAMALGQVRDGVRLVHNLGALLPEEVLGVKPGDAAVVFSFPRYTKAIVNVTEWVKRQGAQVIAICDNVLSPVAQSAHVVLPCEARGALFKHSLVAPLCLANYLIAAVALRDKDATMCRLSKREDLLREWDYFAK